MLRFPVSTPRLLASAIGPGAKLSYPIPQPRTLLNRRFLTDRRNSTDSVTSNKASLHNPTPPLFPGGATPAAPDRIPNPAQSADAPGSSARSNVPEVVPAQVPEADVAPSKPDPSLKLETPLTTESPLPGVVQKSSNPPLPSGAWPTVKADISYKPAARSATVPTPLPPSPSKGSTAQSSPPPLPSPRALASPNPPRKKRRLRRFIILLTLLTGSAFAAGVYYSLRSDNFHDFFTEYVPFGEEAVLYFEEKEFRRRFPNALSRVLRKKDESKVTIPQKSGATWKVIEDDKPKFTELNKDGPHIRSLGKLEEHEKEEKTPEENAAILPTEPLLAKVVDEKPLLLPRVSDRVDAAKQTSPGQRQESTSAALSPAPASQLTLDYVQLRDNSDPIVVDLAKLVNSIISVANASNGTDLFAPVIDSAKRELEHVNSRITSIREQSQKAMEQNLLAQELEFAKRAQGILARVDQEAEKIDERYADQLEHIKDELAQQYGEKLHSELDKTARLFEQRSKNELLEQAIELKRKWISEIKERVEEERNGRLGKLRELGAAVNELEKLIGSWAGVVEENLKTQRLHIAVENVKEIIEDPRQPKPFIRELAALKEVAGDDEVVRAAIASINPRAYQKGIHSPAQLIDRFRRVSEEVRKAALLPENAGVASHAASWILSKVLFKKKGLSTGDDVESILTRTETYLEEGDFDNAAREMNQLRGWAKVLASDWLKEVRLYLEVRQAVEVVDIQARLRALRSPST